MFCLPAVPVHAFSRRQFLRAGCGLGAFMLPRPAAAEAAAARRRAKAVIVILLEGGASHLDTWDPKPDAPAEVRGEFGTIVTAVPGLRFAEHLPLLARQAHLFNVVRSVHSSARNHEPGLHWALTGFDHPAANTSTQRVNNRPAQGAVVAQQLGPARAGLPRYVAIPDRTQLGRRTAFATAAQLGAAYEAFETGEPPAAPGAAVQLPPGLLLPADTPVGRLEDRRALLRRLGDLRKGHETAAAFGRLDAYRAGALELLTSRRLAQALDLSRESPQVRDRYGDAGPVAGRPAGRLDSRVLAHRMGQGALLARRLVEAGVTYVLVNFSINNTWDTHQNNFRALKDTLLPPMDRAVSALLLDLRGRGMLDDVLVLVTTEMGRTPVVNKDAGRDHWPDAYSVLAAGGGLTRGQVLGSTTARGEKPGERPVPVADLLATVYHQLGIDPQAVFVDAQQRPLPILPEARPVSELLS